MMNANEARAQVEALKLNDMMCFVEHHIMDAIDERKTEVKLDITSEYTGTVTLVMIELNKLGYITLYNFQENGTLTIMW